MPKSVAVIALFLSSVVLASEPVPEWLIRLPETTPVVFVAETSAYAFHRFDRAGDSVKKVRQDYMSIGEGGVGKRAAGDQRTPLGVYFVIEQLDTTRLHEKYGAMAFPLDYPNVWDRRHGRTGDGIWIHGVDPRGGVRPPLDTSQVSSNGLNLT
jgi:murein L,D-transpeptidase YafK